jgi:DNA-binding MarR family transcriptional regulator
MTIDLTRDEIWLLIAFRVRGRTVSAFASDVGFARLVEIHYVTKHPQNGRKTLYVITDRGRQALANASQ